MSTTRSDPFVDPRLCGQDDHTDPFVALVRATEMPMILTDCRLPDNPVVFANDAFCRMTGYAREEVVGRNCRFLQGPETDRAAVQRIREAVREARTVRVDLRNHRKGGEPFWNRLIVGPVRDRAGEVAYFYASQEDVTLELERVKGLETSNAVLTAELADRVRALEAAEERLLAAAEAGDLGIWEFDLATGTLFASEHCKRNFGRDVTRPFHYDELLEAVHEDDRARMRAAVAHSVATGEDYRIEYRVVRPDGRLSWVKIQARLKRDAAGAPLYLAGTSQEVTEAVMARRRTELLLALEREVFGAIDDPAEIARGAAEALGRALDAGRAGYGTVDAAAETIVIERDWTAPGTPTLTGTVRFRDHGDCIDELRRGAMVVFDDVLADPRTRGHADALMAIGARSAIYMPITEADALVAMLYLAAPGVRSWTADEIALVREVAHRTRQAVERRRAEHRLRDLAASLERQVRERTAALMQSEAALRQAQKMEAVGQLTGGLAHDFNNLLAAISGSFELLKRQGRDQPGLQRHVDMGQTATRRAAALTHRLLAFSRQQTLAPRYIDVDRLIEGFEDLVRRTIGPQVTLDVRAGAGVWPVLADPGQLENALLNLCINARDAMPDGGSLVVATGNHALDEAGAARHGLARGDYVAICVTDTGSGMPPEVIARAFDPFFTTKPIGVGTGLGLSMVYGFARQSGGQARICSSEGAGTTVCVYLPRHEGEAVPERAALAGATPGADAGRGETVLVVDDEASVRALMVERLGELGYRVLQAADGPRAIQVLQADRDVALLVTDVGLPGGMNGRQVADAARVLIPALRVLFVTGYAETAALSHGHLPEGMQVMTKPFELSALGQRVQALVRAARD
ncbi:MAG TPA: PAS domain S-box protein [Variovorax sp.]|nr:PAS domain S-box protein [Variovorax sp.]